MECSSSSLPSLVSPQTDFDASRRVSKRKKPSTDLTRLLCSFQVTSLIPTSCTLPLRLPPMPLCDLSSEPVSFPFNAFLFSPTFRREPRLTFLNLVLLEQSSLCSRLTCTRTLETNGLPLLVGLDLLLSTSLNASKRN